MLSRSTTDLSLRLHVSILIALIALVPAANLSPITILADQIVTHPNTTLSNSPKASPQQLVVDVYTDAAGSGPNQTMGSYTIGDQIKFYIFINQNCTIEEDIVTPTEDVWPRMVGPVNNGTLVEYFDTQYPTGMWTISVKAYTASESTSDKATFRVMDKESFTFTEIVSITNVTAIQEARFNGKIVRTYVYPVGGVQSWDVRVDRVYFGPEIQNSTVMVQVLSTTRTLGYPPGYVDDTMTLGDEVQVYGLVSQLGNRTTVTLNGSEEYYIKKLSTVLRSPEIILFTRIVYPSNFTVRIDGIAIPGDSKTEIITISWSWGDGQSSDHEFPAFHAYTKRGTYIIMISALQTDGLSTTKILSITIPETLLSETSTRAYSEMPQLLIVSTTVAILAIALVALAFARRTQHRMVNSRVSIRVQS